MMKKLGWVVATLFMLVANFLAIYLPLAGVTTEQLSDKLSTLITPAGFTFAIWSVIYILMLVVTFLFVTNKISLPKKAYNWYIISCLANGLWIVCWHYQNLHLSMIVILVLLFSLIMIDRSIRTQTTMPHYNLVRNSFLVYLWWVQIATLLMTTIYAIYQLNILSSTNIIFPIILIIIAGFINALVISKEKRIATSLVGIWALRGIMSQTPIFGFADQIWTTSLIVGSLLLILILGHLRRYKFNHTLNNTTI